MPYPVTFQFKAADSRSQQVPAARLKCDLGSAWPMGVSVAEPYELLVLPVADAAGMRIVADDQTREMAGG